MMSFLSTLPTFERGRSGQISICFGVFTLPMRCLTNAAISAGSTVVPARYFVAVLRGIFLKGVGFDVLWPQALAMVLYATIGLSLAVFAFRKEIA